MVLVNVTNVRYTKEGPYFIAVYTLSNGKTIKCKVGYVRVGWNEVKYVQNHIKCIDKIVPIPSPIDELGRLTKNSLPMKHHGYCVINFVDSVGVLFAGMDINQGGKEFIQGDMEVTPVGKEYVKDK